MVGSAKSIYDSRTIFTGLFFFILGVAINSGELVNIASADCKCYVGQPYGVDVADVSTSSCAPAAGEPVLLCHTGSCYGSVSNSQCTLPGICYNTVQCSNKNCNDVCKDWSKSNGQSESEPGKSYLAHPSAEPTNNNDKPTPHNNDKPTPQNKDLDKCKQGEQFIGPHGPVNTCGVCLCKVTEAHGFEVVPCWSPEGNS